MDLDEHARVLDAEYSQRVRDYETRDHVVANPSSEVTRMIYIIFGAVEFAHTLHDLEVQLDAVDDESRSDYKVIWTGILITHLPSPPSSLHPLSILSPSPIPSLLTSFSFCT